MVSVKYITSGGVELCHDHTQTELCLLQSLFTFHILSLWDQPEGFFDEISKGARSIHFSVND